MENKELFEIPQFVQSDANVKIGCADPSRESDNEYRVEIFYKNYTGKSVVICRRDRMQRVIRHAPGKNTKKFIIVHSHVMSRRCLQELNEVINTHPDEVEKIIFYSKVKAHIECLNRNEPDWTQTKRTHRIVIEYEIDLADIPSEAFVYNNETDTMLSTMSITFDNMPVPHTHSFATESQSVSFYRNLGKGFDSGTFVINIVANEDNIGARYFYFANTIHRIEPIKSAIRPTGIYFSYTTKQHGDVETHEQFFDLDEGEKKLGLYKTQEEAKYAGDRRLQAETELEQFKQQVREDNARRDRESQELEAERARERAQHDAEVRRLEADRLRLENEERAHALELKENAAKLEKKTSTVKFLGDVIKVLSAVIVAGLSFWTIYLKTKPVERSIKFLHRALI